jgi:hypothetical protein
LPEAVCPKAGRFSGEIGLLDCGRETARVIAVTDSHLPVLEEVDFLPGDAYHD